MSENPNAETISKNKNIEYGQGPCVIFCPTIVPRVTLPGYSTFAVSFRSGFPALNHGSQNAFNHCSLVLTAFS